MINKYRMAWLIHFTAFTCLLLSGSKLQGQVEYYELDRQLKKLMQLEKTPTDELDRRNRKLSRDLRSLEQEIEILENDYRRGLIVRPNLAFAQKMYDQIHMLKTQRATIQDEIHHLSKHLRRRRNRNARTSESNNQSRKGARVEQNQRSDGVEADNFPRTDGVYRTKSDAIYHNNPNTTVYDYLVFKGDRAYLISGGCSPQLYLQGQPVEPELGPGELHYLEVPNHKEPGVFTMMRSSLSEQPQKIQEWLKQKNDEDLPRFAQLKKAGKRVSFTIEQPAKPYDHAYTIEYSLTKTEKGFDAQKNISWSSGKRVVSTRYHFVPFNSNESTK